MYPSSFEIIKPPLPVYAKVYLLRARLTHKKTIRDGMQFFTKQSNEIHTQAVRNLIKISQPQLLRSRGKA